MIKTPMEERLSSDLGRSPFDSALASRDKIVAQYLQKIAPKGTTRYAAGLSLAAETVAVATSVFGDQGGYGPGGGPLV